MKERMKKFASNNFKLLFIVGVILGSMLQIATIYKFGAIAGILGYSIVSWIVILAIMYKNNMTLEQLFASFVNKLS